MTIALAIACTLAGIAYAALQVRMHFGKTPYSPISDPVSNYGVGATARTFRAAAVCNGLVLVLVGALWLATGRPWQSWGIGLLALALVGRLVAAWVPTDLPGAAMTAKGRVHLVAAIVQFAAIYTFLANYGARLTAGSPLEFLTRILTWATLVGLVGVCLGAIRALRRWFGLFERIFLWCATGALVCCAWGLAH